MQFDPILLRTRVLGDDGLLTREWARQQIQVQSGVVMLSQLVSLLEAEALAGLVNERDFTPAIEAVLALLSQETPRVYDDAELRNAIAASDPPQRYDDAELRSAAAGLDAPNLSFQQQIDELRAQIAAGDPPAPLANGATGTVTIPKLTTSNGSLTLQNGIIVAFTNPT